MASEKKSHGSKTWIYTTIMFMLLVSGWFIPEGEIVTALGMKVIGIFIGVMWGWIFTDMVLPSFLGLLFLSFAGLGTTSEIFQKGFGSEIVLLIIFFSVFTKWLENVGLTNTMAQWLLKRKMLVGRPYLFIFMLFFVTFVCSFFVGIYATIFLMWGICYKLLLNLGYSKKEKLTCFVLIGVAYVSIMGMTVKPWSPWSLMGVKGLTTSTGLGVDFLPYSIFMIIISLVSTLIFMFFGKFIVKIDVTNLKEVNYTQAGGKIDYTVEQKLGTFLLLFLLVILYTPSVLAEGSLKSILNSIGSVGMAVIITIVLCIAQRNGKKLMDFSVVAKEAVPWPMVCLLAAVGPLGAALMAEETGIIRGLMTVLKPMFEGQHAVTMYILIIFICCIVTQFMNNTVLLVVLTPMMCALAQMFNANPMLVAALIIFGLTAALATPGASSRAGLIFGNVEWIDIKQAYLQAILSVVAVVIALIFVGIPVGMLLF